MSNIRIRAQSRDGVTTVRCLITHEMETGLRKDEATGGRVPANFIQEVHATWNDQEVLSTYWSGGISTDPYISFKFNGGAAGDTIHFTWVDNQGVTENTTANIS